MQFALLISGEFKEVRNLGERPDDIPHKDVVWLPVRYATGDKASAQRTGDEWVITQAPMRERIDKATILDRLTDAQLEAALSLMSVRQKERWRMPGHPSVYKDDTEVLALLKAVGADPAEVLK